MIVSNDEALVDTNVLVYAHDRQAGDKHEIAEQLLDHLEASDAGVFSVQVLNEFYVVTTRRLTPPLSHDEAAPFINWTTEFFTNGFRIPKPQTYTTSI